MALNSPKFQNMVPVGTDIKIKKKEKNHFSFEMLPYLSCPSIFILPAGKISWLENSLPLYGKFISIIYDTWFIGTFDKLVFCSSGPNIRLLVICDELTEIDADFDSFVRVCVYA